MTRSMCDESWNGRLRSRCPTPSGIDKHLRTALFKSDARYSYALRKLSKMESSLGDVKDDVDLIISREPTHTGLSMCSVLALSLLTHVFVYAAVFHSNHVVQYLT